MTTTKEKILSANNNSNYSPTQSESYKKAEEEVKQNAIDKAEENRVNPPSFETAPRTYGDMLKQFYREKIKGEGLTPEQREKREMRLAKIQDGISAIANLIATTQGAANSFTGQNTRTENTRKKWEDFYKKREQEKRQIYEDKMRALKLEEAIRDRYKDEEEEKKSLNRSPIPREKDIANNQEGTTYNPIQREDNPYNQITGNQQEKTNKPSHEKEVGDKLLQKGTTPSSTGTTPKTKENKIVFDDGEGNEIVIHKDIWKGSMQQVFNTLIDDGIGRGEHTTPERYKARMSKMTDSQKQDFVKMNWNKSKKAKDLMLSYSKKNPPTMTSKIKEEEIENYYPGSKEEIIDYVPGKK